jgi:hypothetical protein
VISRWRRPEPTNELAGGWRLGLWWALYVAFYIMMTMIVPDEEDEEFANSWRRNDCEYLKRGVRGSLAWGFSSLCIVMACRIRRKEEKRILLKRKTVQNLMLGKKDMKSSIEEIIQIIDLAYY